MKNKELNYLVSNAILGSLYVALTLIFAPISYGPIQLRISEILIMIPFYNKKYIPGIVTGTLIANMFSPLGLVDVVFGTVATLLSVILMSRAKNIWVSLIAPTVMNGVIIGFQLNIIFNLPIVPSIIYVAIGEFIIVSIAALLFRTLMKNKAFSKIVEG